MQTGLKEEQCADEHRLHLLDRLVTTQQPQDQTSVLPHDNVYACIPESMASANPATLSWGVFAVTRPPADSRRCTMHAGGGLGKRRPLICRLVYDHGRRCRARYTIVFARSIAASTLHRGSPTSTTSYGPCSNQTAAPHPAHSGSNICVLATESKMSWCQHQAMLEPAQVQYSLLLLR